MALICAISIVYYYGTVKSFLGGDFMFADRLNQTRKERGITAQRMADELCTGIRNYRKYESGDAKPTLDGLVQIADILDVSTDYLLCRDEFLSKHAD